MAITNNGAERISDGSNSGNDKIVVKRRGGDEGYPEADLKEGELIAHEAGEASGKVHELIGKNLLPEIADEIKRKDVELKKNPKSPKAKIENAVRAQMKIDTGKKGFFNSVDQLGL